MYDYEININPDYVDKMYGDEWGAAFLWLDDGNHGVEYNLCYQNGDCCSAIYKMGYDGEYIHTDHDMFSHYEINFNDPNWEQDLITAMKEAAEDFWYEV